LLVPSDGGRSTYGLPLARRAAALPLILPSFISGCLELCQIFSPSVRAIHRGVMFPASTCPSACGSVTSPYDPAARAVRRIWRFLPSVMTISQCGFFLATFHQVDVAGTSVINRAIFVFEFDTRLPALKCFLCRQSADDYLVGFGVPIAWVGKHICQINRRWSSPSSLRCRHPNALH